MARIKCPQCDCKFTVPGKYDDDFNKKISCNRCNFVSSMFSFEYAGKNSFKINNENAIDITLINFESINEEV